LRAGDHRVEISALVGAGGADFPGQNFAGYATPLVRLRQRRRGDIVVGDDGFDDEALAFGELDRHFHVHIVAGVIAVEAGDSAPAVRRLEGVMKAARRRRGEHFAKRHRVDEARADIADEGGLMTRAAAGDDADLAGLRRMDGANDARIIGHRQKIGMRGEQPRDSILDHFLRIIDDSVHGRALCSIGCDSDRANRRRARGWSQRP
jgi:hypothetical protein